MVAVKLSGTNGIAGGYHIHKWPISGVDCDSTGGHYNPHAKPICTASSDHTDCELGDLSGKFGSLKDKFTIDSVYEDKNLPLSGPFSVAGRSIVIHKASDKTRWICANIGYPGPISSAVAIFHGEITGIMVFRQLTALPTSDSSVFTSLALSSNSPQTAGHKWHVHVNPVDSTGDCSSTGGHYNPFGVCLTNECDYAGKCSANQNNCEVGDMSGKHGTLSIPGEDLVTDTNLRLGGDTSIVERSITIHAKDAGSSRIACASVVSRNSVTVVAVIDQDGVKGTVTMTQDAPGLPTKVAVKLDGLASMAGGWH
eukprot:UC1_evm1s610